MDCLSPEDVLRFVTGRLGPDQISAAEEHAGGCAVCLDLLVVAASKGDRADANGGWPVPSVSLELGRFAPPALPAGSAVGRYLLISLVGRGGMGEIYSAYDPELDRRVAIKILNVEPASGGTTAEARARLLREAKAIARLSHPNVVVVFDAGTFGERMFIAMELVEGQALSRWLEVRARSWREVRDVFEGAGRGLAAAHAAGLVHRDFKPQNVMVGWDGKARVADFGLVRGLPTDAEAPGSPPNAAGPVREVEPSLTRTGTVVGTPLYMAPEQFRSEPADARSDQFSFAVALYEGLFGERPFPGETIASLREAVLAGRMREAPANRKVPAWLRRVVLRGLRIDREGRYPSMEPMIEALGRVPGRRRTRLMALVAAVAGATVIAQRAALHPQRMCLGAADRLAGIWESNDAPEPRPRRTAIRQAFLTTGSREAADVWDRVSVGLDRYSSRWRESYTSSCEATHVSGEQSAEVLDLRTTCLRGRLAELKALIDIFASADSAVVGGAVEAVRSLGRIEPCGDVALLRAVVPPPTDERTRAQVEALRSRLAVVQALRDSGRHRQGALAAAALVADARAVGYKPLLAEALLLRGWLQSIAVDRLASEQSLTEAVWAAEASHHDEVKARAAGILVGEVVRAEDAEQWGRFAEAIAERMGPGHELIRAWVLTGRGSSSYERGDFEAGARFARQALAIKRRILQPDDPDVGISLNNLGLALAGLGDYAAALAALDESLAIIKRAYGESSSLGASYLSNRGETLNAQGRHNEARPLFESALRTLQDRYAPDHPALAYPLTGLGEAQLAMGEPKVAVGTLERALRIREQGEPDSLLIADTRFALARALWEATGAASDRARSRTLAASARAAFAAPPGVAAKVSAVDRWLARHPPAPPSAR